MASNEDKDIRIITVITNDFKGRKRRILLVGWTKGSERDVVIGSRGIWFNCYTIFVRRDGAVSAVLLGQNFESRDSVQFALKSFQGQDKSDW